MNSRRNANVEYVKISPLRKAKANLFRVWRKFSGRKMYGPLSCNLIPEKSIFFALQYQPEQSTLSQGIFYANQIALVENISKSLPLGYTLIVKEHPWGRGARPVWQYQHLAELYNVEFCDAPSKEIICRVDAVIAISGTVGFEALILEKPTIILGRTFFTHCNLFYKAHSVQELPKILREILVDRVFDRVPDRQTQLNRFLLSYLNSLIPYFPTIENGRYYGIALADQLGIKSKH
jgi:CDP-glycerol glycerophosphotransferase (TagB/SpsB family)